MVLGATAAQGCFADSGEDAFRDATHYTVQLRTSVNVAFYGEDKGTYRGAGFVVDADRGWILTNAHVAARSPSRIEAAFRDSEFFPVRKIYVDPYLDLALLEMPKGRFAGSAAALDCGESPSVGHSVGAFGHPGSLKFTGTKGIVSGMTDRLGPEFLQTDAAINPGNSGGPLISLASGKVVGISTAALRGAQNTNFAMPAKYACRILDLLREGRDPSPPALHLAYFEDRNNSHGLEVAHNYGDLDLLADDLILRVEGYAGRVDNETELLDALRGHLEGFSLEIQRDGHEMSIAGSAMSMPSPMRSRGVLVGGVLFSTNIFSDGAALGLGTLMVHDVAEGSEGQLEGIRPGDVLESVNGARPRSVEDLYRVLQGAAGGVRFVVKRRTSGRKFFSYVERKLPGLPAVMIDGGGS